MAPALAIEKFLARRHLSIRTLDGFSPAARETP
jgi:hypothetical protein